MTELKTNLSELRKIADGYISFNIKANDTEENQKVHDSFKEFCKLETNNDYTQGLRKLLEYYQSDFKYELIYDRLDEQSVLLEDLRASIVVLNERPKVEEKTDDDEDTGAF